MSKRQKYGWSIILITLLMNISSVKETFAQKWSFGLQTGMNLSKLGGHQIKTLEDNYPVESAIHKYIPGWNFAGILQYHFNKPKNFFLQSGIGFVKRNHEHEVQYQYIDGTISKITTNTISNSFLQVPFKIGYTYKHLNLKLGLSYCYLIGGRAILQSDTLNKNSDRVAYQYYEYDLRIAPPISVYKVYRQGGDHFLSFVLEVGYRFSLEKYQIEPYINIDYPFKGLHTIDWGWTWGYRGFLRSLNFGIIFSYSK